MCHHLASFLMLGYFATLDKFLYYIFVISFLSRSFIKVSLFKVSLYTYFTVHFMLTGFEWFNAILLF